jgi:hypothetical protein
MVLDCREPHVLGAFYSAITGWPVDPDEEEDDWVQLRSDTGATLAFQRADEWVAPEWPGDAHPQQMHLDVDVVDLDVGERQVLALGARKAEHQPGTTFRVYLDPAGHPFCLVLDPAFR